MMLRWLPGILLGAVLLAAWPVAAQDSPEARLRLLGEACLRYADAHGGRLPASLKELYYQAYVNDLALFSLPGGQPVLDRARLDEQSGYALARGAAASGGALPVLAERPRPGATAVPCYFTDRSVRPIPAASVQAPAPTASEAPRTAGEVPPLSTTPPAKPGDGLVAMERWGARRVEVEEGTAFSEQLLQALASAQGVPINNVGPGTVADQLGLLAGDLLIGVAGRPLSSQRDLAQTLAAMANNTPLPMAVVRAQALRLYTVNSQALPQTARDTLARTDSGGKPPAAPATGGAIPWPDVALWARALALLRSQAMVYGSQEEGDANFRERVDKAHLPDGSLAELRYWLADGKWRMSRALFKSEAGRQDWLLAEFNDDGVLWAVHHGQSEAGFWRASLHDNDLNGQPETFSVDSNGDGTLDHSGTDTNGDGRVERVAGPPADQPQSEDLPMMKP